MALTQVAYKSILNQQSGNDQNSKLRGMGTRVSPYDLKNLNIKSINITCSSNCSYPAPTYLWDLTTTTSHNKITTAIYPTTADSVACTGNAVDGMAKTSSLVRIDCSEQKLSGLQLLECKATSNHLDDYITKRVYINCPDGEVVDKSNRSRQISKKMQLKVTTGEMINIVVGCSIGVLLLISGIILICKHRSKDDLDQYTMRQNSIDHSGYRV